MASTVATTARDYLEIPKRLNLAAWVVDRHVAEVRQGMRALEAGRPDVILADCQLPDIDGAGALEIAMRMHPGAPVVMVTGGLSDEEAVKLLQAGAQDYVLKDRLARLGPAVVAAIERANAQARALDDAARLKSAFFSTIKAITRTMELRDPYTAGHQARVEGRAHTVGGGLDGEDDQLADVAQEGEERTADGRQEAHRRCST